MIFKILASRAFPWNLFGNLDRPLPYWPSYWLHSLAPNSFFKVYTTRRKREGLGTRRNQVLKEGVEAGLDQGEILLSFLLIRHPQQLPKLKLKHLHLPVLMCIPALLQHFDLLYLLNHAIQDTVYLTIRAIPAPPPPVSHLAALATLRRSAASTHAARTISLKFFQGYGGALALEAVEGEERVGQGIVLGRALLLFACLVQGYPPQRADTGLVNLWCWLIGWILQ